jgi:hypothetical protein
VFCESLRQHPTLPIPLPRTFPQWLTKLAASGGDEVRARAWRASLAREIGLLRARDGHEPAPEILVMSSSLARLAASLLAIAPSVLLAVAHAEAPLGAPRPITRAPRLVEPSEDERAPFERTGGPFARLAVGASHLRGSVALDGERTHLSATAFSMPISAGFFRNATAFHFDVDLDTGPAPKFHFDTRTVQNESLSMSRYFVGVGFTRYVGRTLAWSVLGSLGCSLLMLETNEVRSEVVAGARGLAARVGFGYDFYQGRWGRLGVVSSLRSARYRDVMDDSIIGSVVVDAGLSMTVGR